MTTHHGHRLEQTRRACPDYYWWQMRRLKTTEPRRFICVVMGHKLQLQGMSVAKSVVFSLVLRFWVAALRAFSLACYVVVGPLTRGREEMRVAKESLVIFFGGGALGNASGGRVKSTKTRTFDSTLGFPGEDVANNLHAELSPSPPPPQ